MASSTLRVAGTLAWGATASVLVPVGCGDSAWGSIVDESTLIAEGRMTSQGEAVEGIEVCALPTNSDSGQPLCDYSAAGGWYGINSDPSFAERANQTGFVLRIRDIDGFDDGYYGAQDIHVGPDQVPTELDIELTRLDD